MHCRHLVFVGKAFRVICSSNRAVHNRFVILPLVAETEKKICEKHLILDISPCLCINVNQYKQYTEHICTLYIQQDIYNVLYIILVLYIYIY